MKRVLIDTNIYIEAMLGNEEIIDKLREVESIGLSPISLGELFAGIKLRKSRKTQLTQLAEFLDSPRVVLYSVAERTADFYSEIYLKLREAGKPIPTNDIWIAATALEHGLTVFTLDKHFGQVAGLTFY